MDLAAFFQDVGKYALLQRALLAGVLASVCCGIMGTFVVTRRISSISGGIAHCVLGGIGAALYLQKVHNWEALQPIHGAVLVSLIAAVLIGLISLKASRHEDTMINAVWAIGMAIGVLFIRLTPGYKASLERYLFGNISMVQRSDLLMVALLGIVIVAVVLAFYKQLLAVCFDDEFARLRGIRADLWYLLLLCLTALTVVMLVQVIGLIMVIALLTLPAAIAGQFTRCMRTMMLVASALGVCFTVLGQAAAYTPEWPPGATIVIIAGSAYLLTLILRPPLARLTRKRS